MVADPVACAGDDQYQFGDSIGFMIGRLRSRMAMVLEADLKDLDISAPQWVILMRIANGLARTSAELCRCFNYDTGSMTRMLDRLEEKGLVSRQRSSVDRRVVELGLSEQGRALYPRLHESGRRLTKQLLKGFADNEQQMFRAFVERMLTNLGYEGKL